MMMKFYVSSRAEHFSGSDPEHNLWLVTMLLVGGTTAGKIEFLTNKPGDYTPGKQFTVTLDPATSPYFN
jgi:hypothetical protein